MGPTYTLPPYAAYTYGVHWTVRLLQSVLPRVPQLNSSRYLLEHRAPPLSPTRQSDTRLSTTHYSQFGVNSISGAVHHVLDLELLQQSELRSTFCSHQAPPSSHLSR